MNEFELFAVLVALAALGLVLYHTYEFIAAVFTGLYEFCAAIGDFFVELFTFIGAIVMGIFNFIDAIIVYGGLLIEGIGAFFTAIGAACTFVVENINIIIGIVVAIVFLYALAEGGAVLLLLIPLGVIIALLFHHW